MIGAIVLFICNGKRAKKTVLKDNIDDSSNADKNINNDNNLINEIGENQEKNQIN